MAVEQDMVSVNALVDDLVDKSAEEREASIASLKPEDLRRYLQAALVAIDELRVGAALRAQELKHEGGMRHA